MNTAHDRLHELLLRHARGPYNARTLSGPGIRVLRLRNARCNDQVVVSARVAGEQLQEIACTSEACAIATASGSLMAEMLSGKPAGEAGEICRTVYRGLLDGETGGCGVIGSGVETVIALRRFPARLACALLPWLAAGRILGVDLPPGIAASLSLSMDAT